MSKMPNFTRLCEAPDWVQNYYRLRIEVEIRSVHGTSFQDLFDKIMRSIHGRDYQNSSSLGSVGDIGCDGYLKSRKIVFACNGPDPYFKLSRALNKLRDDFAAAVENWEIPSLMQQWVFVINYPGVHPSLTQEAETLALQHPGLKVHVWSRADLVEQFMLWARRASLVNEFGSVSSQAKRTPRSYVAPEDTLLPRKQADLAMQKLRARFSCDRHRWESLHKKWIEEVVDDPFACLVVQNQILISVIAAYTMAEIFDPEQLDVDRLLIESEMSVDAWEEHGSRAWGIAMNIIRSTELDDSDLPEIDPIGEDLEKLISTIAASEFLVVGLVRMYSRDSGLWENDCLKEMWHWGSLIKIHE